MGRSPGRLDDILPRPPPPQSAAAAIMDRIRGNRPARRRTQPALSSSFDSLDAAFPTDRISVRSPTMPFANNTTPQTAPQARRGTRQSSTPAAQPLAFSGSSPTAGKAKATRKRARIMGGDGAGDEDDDLPAAAAGSTSNNKKGSHNLRKRPKIDYSAQDFEDEVPEIALAAPRTATRKKRDGSETFADDMTPTAQRGRRAASKTPARRPEHHYPYLPPSDDDVVKDTIEVIGDSSDLHGSDEFSDHDSKVESPAAEAKHSIVAQNDRHPPELPIESPQSKRPIIITHESPALPSPSTSAKATRRIEAEIAHPQPIHINHVSIISTDRSNGPTAVAYSPSHRNNIASSPREAKFTANAVSPIPFPSTERRSLMSTPEAEAEAEALPSLVVTLKLPRPLLQFQELPEPHPEAPEAVKKEAQENAQNVAEDVKREAELGTTVTDGPENSEAVLEQEVDQTTENVANDDVDMDADGDLDLEVTHDVHSVADDEAEAEAHEADSDDDEPTHPWTHLSPYLAGEYVLHPEPTVVGGTAGEEGAEEEPEEADEEDADGEKDDEVNGTETTSTPQTPRRGTPAQFSLAGANTPVPSDKATGPKIPGVRRRKQYKFHKLRDPSEMQELLKDHDSLSHEDLSRHLVVGAEWLESLQQEWQKLGRAIDDYENAKRRGQQDAEFEKKTADLDQFLRLESYVEKDFELRGYRAPLKDKDEGAQRTRWQDKVMAAAYGFEYDPHVSKVGNQDPLAQREGIMAGRQLRSQPQQTAKAAEAGEGGDGLVVVGKRTRNPPKLYDGLTPDDARAATPAESTTGTKVMPKRRGRPPLSSLQHDAADTDTGKPPPKKRGPRGRKSEATVQDTDADTPGPSQEAIAPPPPVETQVNKRRRVTQSRAHVEEDAPGDMDEPDADEPTAKRARTTRTTRGKPSLLRHNSAIFDAETEEDESRPTTSSSNGTISDAGSSYGVGKRQTKRTRNARDEADADASPPQRKRPRINFKSGGNNKLHSSHSEDLLASTLSSLFPPSDHARIVTFRHLGANQWTFDSEGRPSRESSGMPSNVLSAAPSAAPSAPASTTSSAPPSQVGGDDSTKDYSTMTKSEKMSASMKKRWMNGSMQNAVNKRKATLAAKKAAAAALVTGATSSPAPAPAPAPAPTPAPAAQAYPQLQRPPQQRPFINMNGPQGPF